MTSNTVSLFKRTMFNTSTGFQFGGIMTIVAKLAPCFGGPKRFWIGGWLMACVALRSSNRDYGHSFSAVSLAMKSEDYGSLSIKLDSRGNCREPF